MRPTPLRRSRRFDGPAHGSAASVAITHAKFVAEQYQASRDQYLAKARLSITITFTIFAALAVILNNYKGATALAATDESDVPALTIVLWSLAGLAGLALAISLVCAFQCLAIRSAHAVGVTKLRQGLKDGRILQINPAKLENDLCANILSTVQANRVQDRKRTHQAIWMQRCLYVGFVLSAFTIFGMLVHGEHIEATLGVDTMCIDQFDPNDPPINPPIDDFREDPDEIQTSDQGPEPAAG